MLNFNINNSADDDLKRVITWQYDKATNLVAIIQMFKDFFNSAVKNLFDNVAEKAELASFVNGQEVIPANVDEFTLAKMGKILGIKRPILSYTSGDVTTKVTMSKELYRKIIIGRLRLANSDASSDSYLTFVKYIFGNNVRVIYGEDMSLTFEWVSSTPVTQEDKELKAALDQVPDIIFMYPAGVKSSEWSTSTGLALFGQAVMVDSNNNVVSEINVVTAYIQINNTGSATVQIPSGSYFIYTDGTNTQTFTYSGQDLSIDSGKNKILEFSATTTIIPNGTVVVYSEESAIANIISSVDSSRSDKDYPSGVNPATTTSVVVRATFTDGVSFVTIPAGSKATVGNIIFKTLYPCSITNVSNTFGMYTIGDRQVAAGSITSVTDSEGSTIEGIEAFINDKSSVLDFNLDTMDNSSFTWKRREF